MAIYGCNVFPFVWVGDFVYVQQLYDVQNGILRHFEPETSSSHAKYSHKKKCCGIKAIKETAEKIFNASSAITQEELDSKIHHTDFIVEKMTAVISNYLSVE